MSDAITLQGVSKLYRIGARDSVTDSLATTLLQALRAPLRNFRQYRSLYDFSDVDDDGHGRNLLWALRDLDFRVAAGEVVGIVGTNGAGKSTLLKLLSRITPPTRGRITIRGRVSSLLEVGTGFHPELTGRENLYLNGTILGMRRREVDRQFDAIVEFSGVSHFLDTPVKRYSSGMRVRLAFAVAAHLEPEILIIDEVLAVGDAAFQRKCLQKMEQVGQSGRTVLFVSHNMQAVARLCERALLLDGGRLVDDGDATTIVSRYLQLEVGNQPQRSWEEDVTQAPGGEVARLLAVRVCNRDGVVSGALPSNGEVVVEMEYQVLQPGRRLLPHFHLFNDEGTHLFATLDHDPVWQQRPRAVGRYRSWTVIPRHLLSEGTHLVTPAMTALTPQQHQWYLRDAVAFQIFDPAESTTARGDFGQLIGGAVRPLLPWHTEQLAAR